MNQVCETAGRSRNRTLHAEGIHSLNQTATDTARWHHLDMTSAELVDCNSLAPGSRIDVETKSRHYQIECLGGNAIRISGHPEYCPNPVPARLHGSLDKEGVLEFGLIGCGMRFIFLLNDDRPVTPQRVLRVQVDRPGIVQSASSPSIH